MQVRMKVKHGWELESKCHEMKVESKIQSKLKVDLDEMYFIGRMKNKISGSAWPLQYKSDFQSKSKFRIDKRCHYQHTLRVLPSHHAMHVLPNSRGASEALIRLLWLLPNSLQ